MTNKNPFEVRLDVLKMAQDMLESEQRARELKFRSQIEAMSKSNESKEIILSFIEDNTPKSYTSEEIVARSSALYDFIANDKRK